MKPYSLAALVVLAACATKSEHASQPSVSDQTGAKGYVEGKPTATVALAASAAPGAPPMATSAPVVTGGAAGDLPLDGLLKDKTRELDDERAKTRASNGPSASIKAGEWDDNANYREFQRYMGSVTDPVHKTDLRSRRFLVVRDSDGKAVPHCPVTVSDSLQHSLTLTTTASGRAILFPHAEDLSGKSFTAIAACTEDTIKQTFSLNDDGDGTVDLKLTKPRQLSTVRPVDIAFVLDTTGSMSEEIASVKSTIEKVAKTLQGQQVSVRMGLVEYKDRGDSYVTKVYPMSSNLTAFSDQVAGIVASGGGDMPEDMNAGLHTALNSLEWSNQAVTRAAFIIGDAPPHLDYQNEADYAADMKIAAHRGIQLFTIAASGMDSLGQAVWRQMAQYTGATNMFVLRGGAGPQSVGGGDPIASCGGTQSNYASGNLDALIVAKIQHELKSLDVDPMRIPGLVTDENAKPCDQRIFFQQ